MGIGEPIISPQTSFHGLDFIGDSSRSGTATVGLIDKESSIVIALNRFCDVKIMEKHRPQ
jgi:hypothetical protein